MKVGWMRWHQCRGGVVPADDARIFKLPSTQEEVGLEDFINWFPRKPHVIYR